jgi:hypothetical protein
MRVRVWIDGDEGPSHDFELIAAPRIGDSISIAIDGEVEEGVVAAVSWHLQGIERAGGSLALEGEPIGSVTMVHVVCRPTAEVIKVDFEGAEVDPTEAAIN